MMEAGKGMIGKYKIQFMTDSVKFFPKQTSFRQMKKGVFNINDD